MTISLTRLAQGAAAAALLFAVTAPAHAIDRFRSDQLPCASVQQLLDARGAAIIQYPSKRIANYILYDRYVSSSAHCDPDEKAVPASVIAADTLQCGVKHCISKFKKNKQSWPDPQ